MLTSMSKSGAKLFSQSYDCGSQMDVNVWIDDMDNALQNIEFRFQNKSKGFGSGSIILQDDVC